MGFVSIHYFLILFFLIGLSNFISRRFLPHLILLASFYFYACFSLKYLSILFYVICITYFLVKRAKDCSKFYIFLSISLILAPLLSIKFAVNPWQSSAFLPLGISFFSLQAISYFLDVNKGLLKPQSLFTSALYLSFFPQLVAGPIERARDLIFKLKYLKAPSLLRVKLASSMMLIALFKKQVLAERAFSLVHFQDSFLMLFCSTLFFGVYIYLDFSAYCQIARASAGLFSIKINPNFHRPYFASNLQDFWKRWHISLRNFFVDYIYLPLGGNLNKLSSFCVFALSSIWHGITLGFFLWGVWHFLWHAMQKHLSSNRCKQILVTQCIVFTSWFLFQNPNWSYYLNPDFLQSSNSFTYSTHQIGIVFVLFCYFLWEYLEEFSGKTFRMLRLSYQPTFLLGLLFLICLFGRFQNTAFLYFRF
ncbi:hypothetical protein MJH12_09360 [bacterium]|nr:hypothetical protein [bacterium]